MYSTDVKEVNDTVKAYALSQLMAGLPSLSHSSPALLLLAFEGGYFAVVNSSYCDSSYANYFRVSVVAFVIVPIIRCYLSVILSFKN